MMIMELGAAACQIIISRSRSSSCCIDHHTVQQQAQMFSATTLDLLPAFQETPGRSRQYCRPTTTPHVFHVRRRRYLKVALMSRFPPWITLENAPAMGTLWYRISNSRRKRWGEELELATAILASRVLDALSSQPTASSTFPLGIRRSSSLTGSLLDPKPPLSSRRGKE